MAGRIRNPDVVRRSETKRRLRRYGLSPHDYDVLEREQEGRCGICGKPLAEVRVVIDHDHETGASRGLLCSPCNVAMGGFRDDPQVIEAAIAYLEVALA